MCDVVFLSRLFSRIQLELQSYDPRPNVEDIFLTSSEFIHAVRELLGGSGTDDAPKGSQETVLWQVGHQSFEQFCRHTGCSQIGSCLDTSYLQKFFLD